MKLEHAKSTDITKTHFAGHQDEKERKRLLWIALVLLMLSLALLFQDEKGQDLSPAEREYLERESRQKTLKSINHYLQMKHKEQELRAMQTELENRILAGSISRPDFLRNKDSLSQDYGVEMQQEPVNKRLQEDLYDQPAPALDKIDYKINSQVALNQWLGQFEERQRREYIRAFLENARADGYEVRLNERLEVVSVKQVEPERTRNPQSAGLQ